MKRKILCLIVALAVMLGAMVLAEKYFGVNRFGSNAGAEEFFALDGDAQFAGEFSDDGESPETWRANWERALSLAADSESGLLLCGGAEVTDDGFWGFWGFGWDTLDQCVGAA